MEKDELERVLGILDKMEEADWNVMVGYLIPKLPPLTKLTVLFQRAEKLVGAGKATELSFALWRLMDKFDLEIAKKPV